MDLSAKYRKVQAWLDKLYAGKPVPSFERNECTIECLYQLMQRNLARDRDVEIITQDLRQKAVEYTAEGQRLNNILASLNLKTGNLSQSGLMSLRTLANVAMLLQLRDASYTSYQVGLQAVQDEADRVHEEYVAEDRLSADLMAKTKNALLKYSAIHKTCKDLDDHADEQEAKMEKQVKETVFLHTKMREYAKLCSKFKDTLSSSGVDSSLYHENLVKKAQDLKKLEDELEPLRKKLKEYRDLPPDINQAKLKLAELRKDVAHLETEFAKQIDMMKL